MEKAQASRQWRKNKRQVVNSVSWTMSWGQLLWFRMGGKRWTLETKDAGENKWDTRCPVLAKYIVCLSGEDICPVYFRHKHLAHWCQEFNPLCATWTVSPDREGGELTWLRKREGERELPGDPQKSVLKPVDITPCSCQARPQKKSPENPETSILESLLENEKQLSFSCKK